MKMITISEDVYNELMEDSRWLNCLENSGVDNWEGYELARAQYLEEQK